MTPETAVTVAPSIWTDQVARWLSAQPRQASLSPPPAHTADEPRIVGPAPESRWPRVFPGL